MARSNLNEAIESCSAIPTDWLAVNRVTESGLPALFPSNRHASMAIRIAYLHDLDLPASEVAVRLDQYVEAQHVYETHCHTMRSIVESIEIGELQHALDQWAAIDQAAVNRAFRRVLGECETDGGQINLVTLAWRHFDLNPLQPMTGTKAALDRKLRESDSNAAWGRADSGQCNGCGLPTISPAQRQEVHRLIQSEPVRARLVEQYPQRNGKLAPLWPVATIAAKGVAEHVVARSMGGRTNPSNLTNCCAGCNYSRNDSCMDTARIARYERPESERSWVEPTAA